MELERCFFLVLFYRFVDLLRSARTGRWFWCFVGLRALVVIIPAYIIVAAMDNNDVRFQVAVDSIKFRYCHGLDARKVSLTVLCSFYS